MTNYLDRYAAAATPFTSVVTTLSEDQWGQPSPCAGWTAADVLAHVQDTERDFVTRQGLTLPEADGDRATSWVDHDAAMRGLLADPEIADRVYQGYFGPTTIGQTLVDFYAWDLLVHRWDIATAAGLPCVFGADELDAIDADADAFGDMLYSDGICGPAVPVSADAPRQTRVLARLGRRG